MKFGYQTTDIHYNSLAKMQEETIRSCDFPLRKRRLSQFVVSVFRSLPSIHLATQGTRGERKMYRTIASC